MPDPNDEPIRISELFKNKEFHVMRKGETFKDEGLKPHINHRSTKEEKCKHENIILIDCAWSRLQNDYSNVKNVIFYHCEKNFTFHNSRPSVFPNAENIVIFGHPCDSDVLYAFYKISEKNEKYSYGRTSNIDNVNIYLTDKFYHDYFKKRRMGGSNKDNIYWFLEDDCKTLIDLFDQEKYEKTEY